MQAFLILLGAEIRALEASVNLGVNGLKYWKSIGFNYL